MRVQVLVHLLWLLNLDSLFSTGLCRANSHALVQLSSAMSFNQIAALGRLLTASAQHSCCASCLYQCTYCSPGFCPASMSKPKQSSGLQHQGGATSDRLVCQCRWPGTLCLRTSQRILQRAFSSLARPCECSSNLLAARDRQVPAPSMPLQLTFIQAHPAPVLGQPRWAVLRVPSCPVTPAGSWWCKILCMEDHATMLTTVS